MKSFLSMLPLAGLALAQGQCAPGITVTETSTEKVTVTVQPSSYVEPSAIATPNSQDTKPSPYYPIGNSTANGPTNYPTHTPQAPTSIETYILPTSDVISASVSVSSSSSKKVKTIYVVPSPINPPSSSQAAAAPAATSQAAVSAPVADAPAPVPAADADVADVGKTSANAVTGSASFYGGNLAGGACSFSGYTLPSSLFGTAFGGTWDASQCGACVSVTNAAGKSIKAMVRTSPRTSPPPPAPD